MKHKARWYILKYQVNYSNISLVMAEILNVKNVTYLK